MMEEGQASYRDNYKKLAMTKAKYDPANLFRVNQNIQPVS
jgi:Berberine and berberine like